MNIRFLASEIANFSRVIDLEARAHSCSGEDLSATLAVPVAVNLFVFGSLETLSVNRNGLFGTAHLLNVSLTVFCAVNVISIVLCLEALSAKAGTDALGEVTSVADAATGSGAAFGTRCGTATLTALLAGFVLVVAYLTLDTRVLRLESHVLAVSTNWARLLFEGAKWTVVT